MTEVTFHFNVPDKVHYACRLLRKAQAGGARLAVLADADTLRALDVALWTFSAPDFVAHCGFDAPAAMRAERSAAARGSAIADAGSSS